MVSLNNISKEFGGEILFDDISFNISNKERIGFAGKNGAGKSTLLNIIAGELIPDKGELVISKDTKIGYLKQEMKTNQEKTVIDETLEVLSFITDKKNRIDEITHQLSNRTDYTSKSYSKLIDEIDHINHEVSLK